MSEGRAPGSHRIRVRGVILGLVLSILVLVLFCSSWRSGNWAAPPPLTTADSAALQSPEVGLAIVRNASYAGDVSCAECHPGEWALYERSGHHRTMGRAEQRTVAAWLNGRKVNDPELPGVTWSYHLRHGKLVVDRTIGGKIESMLLDYALGSGTHGITFVATPAREMWDLDPTGIEHRLSYFPEKRLGMTPGQRRTKARTADVETVGFGRAESTDRLQKCFGCHATLTSSLTPYRLELSTLIPNVSCERCHGPGLPHIEAARRGDSDLRMRFGFDRVEPSVEVAFCGECHRVPAAIPYSSIYPDNPDIVRFQGVGISRSRCYGDGRNELRCTSCHEPHDRVSRHQGGYDAVCLSCHRSGSAQQVCPVSPAENCIRCHMPRRELVGNGIFTDHWIRKPAGAAHDSR
jgi:hypothetical protein